MVIYKYDRGAELETTQKEPTYHYSKRIAWAVDPKGVANLYGLWDWVGMAPRMGPESRS